MKLTKILFILSLALSSSAYSEILKEIKISGNKNISNQTIIVYGEIEKEKNYEEKDINQIVQKLYATDLFENIDLNFQNNILSIKVIEFKNISKLTISGEKSNRDFFSRSKSLMSPNSLSIPSSILATSNNDGVVFGSKENPFTIAPSLCNQSTDHPPLKPV